MIREEVQAERDQFEERARVLLRLLTRLEVGSRRYGRKLDETALVVTSLIGLERLLGLNDRDLALTVGDRERGDELLKSVTAEEIDVRVAELRGLVEASS